MKHLPVIKFRLIALCDSRSTHVPWSPYMFGGGYYFAHRCIPSSIRLGEDSNLRKA